MESKLVVKLDGSQAKREAAAVDNSLGKMEKAGTSASDSLKRLGTGAVGLGRTLSLLRNVVISVGVAMAVRKVYDYADSYTNLRNRLKNVIDNENELIGTEKKLFDLAQNTRAGYETTVVTYTRLALATKTLNLSQTESLRITETLNKAVALGGSNAREAAAGLIQFSQGLASGRLQGDELRSVSENLIGVTTTLIEGFKKMKEQGEVSFNVTRANFRKLASEGVLTSTMLTRSLLLMGDTVDLKFGKMALTMGQAFTALDNSIGRLVGTTAQAEGISTSVAQSIKSLSESIDDLNVGNLMTMLEVLTAIAASRFLGPLILGFGKAQIAQMTYTAEVLKGTAAAAAYTAVTKQRAAAEVAGIKHTLAALVAERNLEIVRLNAQITAIGRMKSHTRLAEIRTAELGITNLLTAAEARATVATNVHTVAMNRASLSAGILTGALGILKNIMALLGGPLGVIMLAVGALYIYSSATGSARDATKGLRDEVEKLADGYKKLSIDKIEKLVAGYKAQIAGLVSAKEAATSALASLSLSAGSISAAEFTEESARLQAEIKSLNVDTAEAEKRLRALNLAFTEMKTGQAVDEAEKLKKAHEDLKKAQADLLGALMPLTKAWPEYSEKLATLNTLFTGVQKETSKYKDLLLELQTQYGDLFPEIQANIDAEEDLLALRADAIESNEDLVTSMEQEIILLRMAPRDRAIATAALRVQGEESGKTKIEVEALAGTLYDLKNSEKAAADEAEDLSTVLNTQLKREVERLDDAFVDLWKSGLDSFEDFKSSLINSFKQMMATLIHEATTKKLVSFVGGMLGAGTATAGSGAASVVSGGASSVSMLQGLSSFASDPGSTLSGLSGDIIAGIGTALERVGFESAAESFVSAGFENIVNATAMQMGATFIAGIAGSFAGNAAGEALFGKQAESNIGATIGGTIGAIWGAPGAFIGSTIGSMADVAFGGDGKKRAKLGVGTGAGIFSGGSVQDSMTAASGLELTALAKRVGDDTGGQSAIDMMNNMAAIDEVLTTATRLAGETVDLAGVSLAGRGTQGDGGGPATGFGSFGFNGLDAQALIDAPKEFIISWIDEVSATFDSGLRESVTNLTGTAEEILSQYAEVLTLKGLIDSFDETFTMVIGLEEAFNGLGETGLSSYNQMLDYADALTTLADNAGPEHVELLSSAVQGLGEISRQVADQIMAAKAQIEGDFDSLINKIQYDLLDTERDRYDFLKSQADALSETLGTLTDPEQIRDTASQIQQLTGQAFGVLGDTSQSAMSGEIIGFLEGVESQAQSQLDAAMQIVETIADPTAAGSPANAIEAALSRWETGFMGRYQAFLDAGEAAQAENAFKFGISVANFDSVVASFPETINVNVDVGELTP